MYLDLCLDTSPRDMLACFGGARPPSGDLADFVQTRQLICYLHFLYTKHSLKTIGSLFNYDHATVLHAKKTIANLIFSEAKFRETTDIIKTEIVKKIEIVNSSRETKESVFKTLLKEVKTDDVKTEDWIERFTEAI